MKNVQYYLKTLDRKKLVEEYYDLVKEGIFEYKDKDITIEEFELGYKIKISEFIEKLINMEIKETKDQGIILAYKSYEEFLLPKLFVGLLYENELKEKKLDTWFYAYEFLHQSEILSFLVSDSKYTQENIYEVVANVLYEASFFGFDEKNMEEHKEKLQESINDIESGNYKTRKPDFLKKKKKDLISDNNEIIDSLYDKIKEKQFLENDIIMKFTESDEEKMEDKISEVLIRTVLNVNNYLVKQEIKHIMNELGIK